MSKLEKRLKAEYESYEFHVTWVTFLRTKYEEAVDKKQFALANEIQSLTTVELD